MNKRGDEVSLSADFEQRETRGLAAKLRCSRDTIERRIRAGSFPYPELPRLDKKRRWSLRVVERIMSAALR